MPPNLKGKRTMRKTSIVKASNLQKPPIRVKHSELKRAGDSAYRSVCPVCKNGMLLMRRDLQTLELLKEDICILCGQHFIYEEMPVDRR